MNSQNKRFLSCTSGLLPVLAFLAALPAAKADVTKADNTSTLNLDASYSGGVAPTSSDRIIFDSTIATAANVSYAIGDNLSVAGLQVVSPVGAITINSTAGKILTLGTSGIDLSTATQDLKNNAVTALSGAQTWTVQTGRTLTQGGLLDLAGNTLTLNGVGTRAFTSLVKLNGANLTTTVGTTNLASLELDSNNYINSGGAGTLSGLIFGTGGYTQNSGSTTTISYGANSAFGNNFSGGITQTAGTLNITGINGAGSGAITTSGGTLTISTAQLLWTGGLTLGGGTTNLTVANSGGKGAIILNAGALNATTNTGALQNNTVTLNGGTFSPGAIGNIGALSGTQGFTIGATSLTLGFNNASPAAYSGNIAGSTASNLIKVGSGAQILNGTLSLTNGTILVNGTGGTLEIGGQSTNNGAVTVNAGTLKLNFNTGGVSNLLNPAAALTLGGGTLAIVGTTAGADVSQNFASTAMTAGSGSTVSVVQGGSPQAVLNLGAITRNAGSAVNFILPTVGAQSAANGITTTTVNGGTSILGGWATVNGTDWAVVNGTNNITALGTYYTTGTGGNTGTNYLSTADVDVTSSQSLDSSITINSLRFNDSTARTLTLTGPNTVTNGATGGILITGNVPAGSKITGGSLTSTTDLVIHQNSSQPFTLDTIVTGPTILTKAGTGTLILTQANTQTGNTYVDAGTLRIGAGGSLANSIVSLSPNNTSAVFDVNNQTTSINGLAGGSSGGLIGGISSGGYVNLGDSGNLTINTGSTFNGALVGGANSVINKNGAGTQSFSGSTQLAFNGTYNINAGSFAINNVSVSFQNTNFVIASGASINSNAAGGSWGNLNGAGLISTTQTTAFAYNFGYLGGAAAFSGVIQNGSSAALSLNKYGSGASTFSGANTYTGTTTVFGGNLIYDYSTGSDVIAAASPGALTLSGGTLTFRGGTGAAVNSDTTGTFGFSGNLGSSVVLDSNGGTGFTLTMKTAGGFLTSNTGNNVVLFDTSSSAGNVLKTDAALTTVVTGTVGIKIQNGLLATGLTNANNYRANILIHDSTGYGYATQDASNNIVRYTGATLLVPGVDESTTLSETVNYKLSSNLFRTTQFLYNTLELDSSLNPVTLDVNTTAFARFGNGSASVSGRSVLATGTNGATITGGGGTNQVFYVNNYLTGNTVAGQTFTIDIDLLAANFFSGKGLTVASRTVSGDVYLESGVLRQTFAQTTGDALTGGASVYRLLGGVLEIGADLTGTFSATSAYDFSRPVGVAAGQVMLIGDTGFSAFGGNRTVNLGGTGAMVTWGQDNFLTANNNNNTSNIDGNFTFKLSSIYSDSTIDFQNAINLNASNRVVQVDQGSANIDARLSGVISNSNTTANTLGSLTKTGLGALELTGANTYNGTTTVSAGALLVNNITGSGTGTGKVTVGTAATLGGIGTISGAVALNSGAILNPGNGLTANSRGLLTLGNSLTLNTTVSAGSNVNFDFAAGAIPANRGIDFDAINITGALTYGGVLTLNFAGTAADGAYPIFGSSTGSWLSVGGGSSGDFSGVVLSGLGYTLSSVFVSNSGVWTGMATDGTTFKFTDLTGVLNITSAVPEPSTYAAMFGAAVLAFAAIRRRRKVS